MASMRYFIALFSFISLLTQLPLHSMQQNFPKSAPKENMSYIQGGALVALSGYIGWAGYNAYQYQRNYNKFRVLDHHQMRQELLTRPRVIKQSLDQDLPPVLGNIVNEYDVLSPKQEESEFWNKAPTNYYFNRHPDIKKMNGYSILAGCITALVTTIGLAKTFNFSKRK